MSLKIKPQVEVFDTNMISNAYNLVDRGLLEPPIEFGFVMGAPNAQECSLRQLGHLTSMLRPGDTWTSVGVGKFEMPEHRRGTGPAGWSRGSTVGTSRGTAVDASWIFRGTVAAPPRMPRGYSVDESRRRRGCHVDISWGRDRS